MGGEGNAFVMGDKLGFGCNNHFNGKAPFCKDFTASEISFMPTQTGGSQKLFNDGKKLWADFEQACDMQWCFVDPNNCKIDDATNYPNGYSPMESNIFDGMHYSFATCASAADTNEVAAGRAALESFLTQAKASGELSISCAAPPNAQVAQDWIAKQRWAVRVCDSEPIVLHFR